MLFLPHIPCLRWCLESCRHPIPACHILILSCAPPILPFNSKNSHFLLPARRLAIGMKNSRTYWSRCQTKPFWSLKTRSTSCQSSATISCESSIHNQYRCSKIAMPLISSHYAYAWAGPYSLLQCVRYWMRLEHALQLP